MRATAGWDRYMPSIIRDKERNVVRINVKNGVCADDSYHKKRDVPDVRYWGLGHIPDLFFMIGIDLIKRKAFENFAIE